MLRSYILPPAGNARSVFIAAVLLSTFVPVAVGQAKDPGPRAGTAGAGSYFSTLNANEQQTFLQALARFQEVDSVSGAIEAGSGLGPTFNGNSCAMCHAQPAVGGSSPGQNSPQNPVPNPQIALAKLDGATNTVPSFITASGPVRGAVRRHRSDQRVFGAGWRSARSIHHQGALGCEWLQSGATELHIPTVVRKCDLPNSHASVRIGVSGEHAGRDAASESEFDIEYPLQPGHRGQL
jgi:hypothetical protein